MAVANLQDYFGQIREFWAVEKPAEMFDRAGPWGKMIRKDGKATWIGKGEAQLPEKHIQGGGAGADFTAAFAHAAYDAYAQFKPTMAELWSILQLTWRDIELGSQPGYALSKQTHQLERQAGRMESWMHAFSYTIWGDGTGRIAKGDGGGWIGTLVARVMNRMSLLCFDKGDIVQFINGNTTRPGLLKVEGYNREAQTLTFTSVDGSPIAAITDAIPGATSSDYLAKAVDRAAINTGNIFDGFFTWCPRTHTEAITTLYGVDRSELPEKLAGKRIALPAGTAPLEAVREMIERAETEGIPIDTIVIPRPLWNVFERQYESHVVSKDWMEVPGDGTKLTFGVTGLKWNTTELPGPVMITSDKYLTDHAVATEDDETYVGMKRNNWQLVTGPTGVDWWTMGSSSKLQGIVGSQQVVGCFGTMGNVMPGETFSNMVAGRNVVAQ